MGNTQIALYRNLLSDKYNALQTKMSRLENGLEKLKSTAQQVKNNHHPHSFLLPLLLRKVDDLKAKLAAQEAELTIKNEEANKLIQVVGAETDKVELGLDVSNLFDLVFTT